MRFSRIFLNRLQNQPGAENTVVVIDVLRSFTTAAVALAQGASAIYPVEGVAAAIALAGKIQYPVKGATLIGSGPECLKQVSMIGNDVKLDSGVGTCGKEGQSVPVGVGQPTLRIDGLTVGGTV